MSDERITVYSQRFSVPGTILQTSLGTVRIGYFAPDGMRTDWFHVLGDGPRAGRRMGDPSDTATRYSVSPAMPDEPTPDAA
jgi:hypothetical protein